MFDASLPHFVNRTSLPVRRDTIQPLEMRAVSLRFRDTLVIDNVDLDLSASGCTVILGPNGAGKSLLLRLMHGLLAPSSGTILWAGQPPARVIDRQAMVFQKPILLRRSVLANLRFVLKARGLSCARCEDLLERVGLSAKAHAPARMLSGGEAQRLALARALATEPEILFLDEPTASLDPASVLTIDEQVSQLKRDGVRIIYITHDIRQARRMADDIVFMHRGRVREHSPAQAFFDRPRYTPAQEFLDGRVIV